MSCFYLLMFYGLLVRANETIRNFANSWINIAKDVCELIFINLRVSSKKIKLLDCNTVHVLCYAFNKSTHDSVELYNYKKHCLRKTRAYKILQYCKKSRSYIYILREQYCWCYRYLALAKQYTKSKNVFVSIVTHMYRTLKYSKETQAKLVAWYDLEFLHCICMTKES